MLGSGPDSSSSWVWPNESKERKERREEEGGRRRGGGGREEGRRGGGGREEVKVGSSLAWPRPFLELLLRKKSALTF